MSNDVMGAVKLSGAEIAGINQKLEQLSVSNTGISELAYSNVESKWDGCGCKGSCMGGCTSW